MVMPFCNCRVESIYSLSPHLNKLVLWCMYIPSEGLLGTRLGTETTNQEADTRVVGSLALTSVVSSYNSLMWMGQCLVPIWEIEDVENQAAPWAHLASSYLPSNLPHSLILRFSEVDDRSQ